MTNIVDTGSSNIIMDDQTGVSPGKVVKDVTPTITSPHITGIVTGGATYNNITLSGTSVGTGIAPLGAVVPVASNLTGSFSIPISGTVSSGWQLCNGVAIPGGNTLSGNTPNLTDNRFLMGSSSAGTASGTNLITPVGSIGGSQSIQHHHTFAHTHTTDSQLGTILLQHFHSMDTHDHEYKFALLTSTNPLFYYSAPAGPNASMGGVNDAGVYDYSNNRWAGAVLNGSYVTNFGNFTSTSDNLRNRSYSSGYSSTSSANTNNALTNYNASHSHTTTSQNTTDTSDNTGSNAVNGSNFSFTGTQFDSRPQYFSVQYIIRVS